MMNRVIVVMGKAPEPGAVKTRLIPPLDPEQAAQLYGAFLRDTLLTALAVRDAQVILVHPPTNDLSLLDPIVPLGVTRVEDFGTDLGDSMNWAFQYCFDRDALHVVLIGSDLPTLPEEILETAFDRLENHSSDVVLGPSIDGGYYLIGLRSVQPDLFTGIIWSGSRVLDDTLAQSRRTGRHTTVLLPWHDIDRPADLEPLRQELDAGSKHVAPTTRRVLTIVWPTAMQTDDPVLTNSYLDSSTSGSAQL